MITLELCGETLEQLKKQTAENGSAPGQGTGWNPQWEPYLKIPGKLAAFRESGDEAGVKQALACLNEIAGNWQQADAMSQAVYVWILTEAARCLEQAADYMRLAQEIADVRIRADRDTDGDTAAAVAAALMALPYKHMPRYVPAFLRHAYIYHARFWANIAVSQKEMLTDAGRFFLQFALQRLMDERKGYRW